MKITMKPTGPLLCDRCKKPIIFKKGTIFFIDYQGISEKINKKKQKIFCSKCYQKHLESEVK